MMYLAAVAFFVLGTIIGSFLNVVIIRYGTGRTLGGRSRCALCGRTLPWHDLVPVVSFFLRRGRCRFCKARFSWQYPIVEGLTGFLFLGVVLKNAFFLGDVSLSSYSVIQLFVIGNELILWPLLLVIAVYDLRHKIIPDALVWTFATLSLVSLLAGSLSGFPLSLSDWLNLSAGPLFALPFFLLWFFSRGRWIGLGDAKLALGIGWFLGLAQGASALVLGFWVGAIVSLLLLGLSRLKKGAKGLTMKSEIPLAPFLIAGVALVYFFGFDVVGLGSSF